MGPFKLIDFLRALQTVSPEDYQLVQQAFRTAWIEEDQPSPQLAPFVELGEYDNKSEYVLVKLTAEMIPTLCCMSVGDLGCFCATPVLEQGGNCGMSMHSTPMDVQPGWYISGKPVGSGWGQSPTAKKIFYWPYIPLDHFFGDR